MPFVGRSPSTTLIFTSACTAIIAVRPSARNDPNASCARSAIRTVLSEDDSVRNGYREIRVSFEIDGDADDERLRGLVEQSRAEGAFRLYDALTNPTPVVIDVVTNPA